jgi:hypothetical protein
MKTTWRIANLKRDQSTGLVFELSYLIMFELEGQKAHYFETIPLQGDANDSTFIPFENLTEDVALSWAKSTIGADRIAEIEKNTKIALEEKIVAQNQSQFLDGVPWQ